MQADGLKVRPKAEQTVQGPATRSYRVGVFRPIQKDWTATRGVQQYVGWGA